MLICFFSYHLHFHDHILEQLFEGTDGDLKSSRGESLGRDEEAAASEAALPAENAVSTSTADINPTENVGNMRQV
ncbi:unnamed protein product [Gongylonema pulchrum]|uniref:Uncharacterized protein n=1 Tax=Gongylonema pulchrum TaxID=637853 RepID=A0A183DDF4_9BILA|nr:unnamed protein product [Gongylonema pulchrum]